MDYQITFAQPDAEAELRGILLECDMDLAGDIEEHVLIKSGAEIIGGAMLAQTGADVFHLVVIAVKESARSNGTGSILIQELIGQPWKHCLNATAAAQGAFIVTTVAKGKSAGFYRKIGFAPCDFSGVAEPFRGQCNECPERGDCHPVAMTYQGRNVPRGAARD